MCSIKKLFLEILQYWQKNMCQSLFFNKVVAFRPLSSIIKQYCSCCIRLIRIDTILSKNVQNNLQNLLFKKWHTQPGNQTDIFWNFYLPADTFWLPKTVEQVFGYTTVGKKLFLHVVLIIYMLYTSHWFWTCGLISNFD